MPLDNFSESAPPPTEQAGQISVLDVGSQQDRLPSDGSLQNRAQADAPKSEQELDDEVESKFFDSLINKPQQKSLYESLQELNPEQTNPFALQAAQGTLGVMEGFKNTP